LAAAAARAGTVEVEFRVPVRAELDLRDKGTVTILPFLIATEEGEAPIERRGVNVRDEFEGYLRRLLRRRTQLKYVEAPAIDYPTYDLTTLARDTDFWRVVGERSACDLILTGSLDFDVQDRSGYRTEEYISPFDGRTYYRQVLVEQTGFEYDIVMQVYDGRSGALLHSDNFKDFRQFEGEGADPLAGMFENLYALEDRIAGVFAKKDVPTTRVLFTD
ncbi:MAG: hypothetical protein ACRD0X_07400, partial [Thermoanaerobaculia bacterium]